MIPPTSLQCIFSVKNTSKREKKKKLYSVCEGTNTEPNLLEDIFTQTDYITNKSYDYYSMDRTENDKGANTLEQLVEYGKSIIENKENKFKKKKDKVIIFFDLDRYRTKINEVKKIINENKDNMVFVFTNPAIELFLLLCVDANSYEAIVEPNKEKILKNEWYPNDSDPNRLRYVNHLLQDKTGIDPKSHDGDMNFFAKNLQYGVNQEKMYLSQKLTNLESSLISNFSVFVDALNNETLNDIKYDII